MLINLIIKVRWRFYFYFFSFQFRRKFISSTAIAPNGYRINAVQNLRWFVWWQFCIEFNPLLAVCVRLVRLPVSFSSFLFFEGRKSLNHFVNNFFQINVAHTKLYRIFVV